MIIYFFVFEIEVSKIAKMIKISVNTISQYFNQFRIVMSNYLLTEPFYLGGVNKKVSIDECLALKRKYNTGRIVPQIWLFGVMKLKQKKGF